jgi:hypothetical protein
MATRIARLMGFTPGCELKVAWNHQVVFDGTVPAIGEWTPDGGKVAEGKICEWQTDTAIVGSVPVSIECKTGSLLFVNIHVNNWFEPVTYSSSDQAQWPKAVPTHQDVELLGELSPEQILEKYGVDLTIFRSWIVETCGNAEEHFGQPIVDLDLSVSDGKDNVMIDGASRSRHSVETLKGAWHYPIFAGQTLTCDFRVDQPPQSLQL